MESVVSKVMNRREGDNKRALIKKVTGAIVLFIKKRVCNISVFLFISSVFLASYLVCIL